MNNKTTITPTNDQYFLFVGGSYNGKRIKLGTNEPEELIQIPDKVQVGLTLSEDPAKGKLTHPQIYKFDYSEKHYTFVETVN